MLFPYLQTFIQGVSYHSDPTLVFATLCQEQKNTLLLESAEIDSKNSVKSLLLAKAAVKISCHGQKVTFQALTPNGQATLATVKAYLLPLAQVEQPSPQTLIANFSPLDLNLDEDTKLKSATVLDGLRAYTSLYRYSQTPIFLGGLFAYDLVRNFIPMQGIELLDDGLTCPDYVFYLAEQLIYFDHQDHQAQILSFCFTPDQGQALLQEQEQLLAQFNQVTQSLSRQEASTEVQTNIPDPEFKQIIRDLKHYLNCGDVFQIVPSRRFSLPCPNELAAYKQLKENNPSPYMFFMQDEEFTLFGASPESALKYTQESKQLEIYPIAGSRPRGFNAQGQIDPDLDARLELELRLDHKELAEHLMLVDLARNDVARVCESGTRHVKDLMQVDRYSHIMHLVSRVVGTLRSDLDALHAYQACLNMGTLTGAPKIKAQQLIYQFEKQKRHAYGGAVGYLDSHGNLDTCIVIRSAFVQNGTAYIQAGCGTVLDSDPQAEADETKHKARAVIKAISQVNQG